MVKAKSQLEKRIDAQGSAGGYTAGDGIYINETTKKITLKTATDYSIGGVKVDTTDDGGFVYPPSPLRLKYATAGRMGGLKLSDGLIPDYEESGSSYSHTGGVMLRLGGGLQFEDYPVAENDEYVKKLNSNGGKPVGVAPGRGIEVSDEGKVCIKASKGFIFETDGSISTVDYAAGNGIKLSNHAISVKIGKGLEFDDDGIINVTATGGGGSYAAGDGIEITDGDEDEEPKIAAKIGEGLEIGEEGEIKALANIENAVIISEADAKYLLHNYTQVEYISGNKIGYAGGQNQIVAQGIIIYKSGGTAPNGVAVSGTAYVEEDLVPDIPLYTDVYFSNEILYTNPLKTPQRTYIRLNTAGATYDSLNLINVNDDGTETNLFGFNSYDTAKCGFSFVWNSIHPPGYTSNGVVFPYGCAICSYALKYKQNNVNFQFVVGSPYFVIGFASQAEYNAAVGLTYEPNVLTQVNDTVTEV